MFTVDLISWTIYKWTIYFMYIMRNLLPIPCRKNSKLNEAVRRSRWIVSSKKSK